jgi:hypothetical protein
MIIHSSIKLTWLLLTQNPLGQKLLDLALKRMEIGKTGSNSIWSRMWPTLAR